MAAVRALIGLSIECVRDHIGYRCASEESYLTKYEELTQHGTLLHEKLVAARRIAVFRLQQPVRGFSLFALQAPRPEEEPWEGVEHLGYVVQDLGTCHEAVIAHETLAAMPVKQVALGRYFKFYFEGIEIEFRDTPIEEG